MRLPSRPLLLLAASLLLSGSGFAADAVTTIVPPVPPGNATGVTVVSGEPSHILKIVPLGKDETALAAAVLLQFRVQMNGSVSDATAVQATDVRFIPIAEDEVLGWRFKPGTRDGVPVSCVVQMPILFAPDAGPHGPVSKPIPPLPPGVFEGNVDRRPIPIHRAAPHYPTFLQVAGTAGSATVLFTVGTDGSVESAEVVEATDAEFGEAAVAAVRTWQFKPALMFEKPVRYRLQIPIEFDPKRLGQARAAGQSAAK